MRKFKFLIFIILFCILGPNFAQAQITSPVTWSYSSKKISKNEAILYLKATIESRWHIYSTKQDDGGPEKTTFSFTKSSDYNLIDGIVEPVPIIKFEKVFGINVLYFEKSVVFKQRVKLKTSTTIIKGKVEFMVCNDNECIPTSEVDFKILIK